MAILVATFVTCEVVTNMLSYLHICTAYSFVQTRRFLSSVFLGKLSQDMSASTEVKVEVLYLQGLNYPEFFFHRFLARRLRKLFAFCQPWKLPILKAKIIKKRIEKKRKRVRGRSQ